MLIWGFFSWRSSMQYLSTGLYHMGLHKKKISGKNQSCTTSLKQNLTSWKDCRLSWGGEGRTGRLLRTHKSKCWLKQRQRNNSTCAWCRSPAAWRWLCPGKSVPGSAKGSQFKLKEIEQWLSAGESLIVWVTQSEWEQPRAGRRTWQMAGRWSNQWMPWQGEGFDQSKLRSCEQGILSSSSMCSALIQGGYFGVEETWQTLLRCERKHFFKSVKIGNRGKKCWKSTILFCTICVNFLR